jgi:hypothetical protein
LSIQAITPCSRQGVQHAAGSSTVSRIETLLGATERTRKFVFLKRLIQLVDTTVWVSQLREGDDRLAGLLDEGVVC